MKRVLVAVLIVGLGSPAFADIRSSAGQEAARVVRQGAAASATQVGGGSSRENPYFLPSVALMGAGGVVALYGAVHDTGVSCSGGLTSLSCGTTKSKATIFTGLGMVGVGAFLFHKGKQRSSSPEIVFGPAAVGVRKQIAW